VKGGPFQIEMILGNQHPMLIAKPAFGCATESIPYISFPGELIPEGEC
jgi:hypothetical protein